MTEKAERRLGALKHDHGVKVGAAVVFTAAAFGLLALLLTVRQGRLSDRENILIQFLFFALGAGASYVFGRFSARSSAIDMLKPHARSAFRRLLWLYDSFFRMAHEIERAHDPGGSSTGKQESTQRSGIGQYDALRVMVVDQIEVGKHAIEDWRDIIPQDVEDVETRARETVQTLETERGNEGE